ncbi:MAG TPA: DUF2252 family protein [Candidatus Limnocylindria bacterium]|jgi:hypothetical protein|nr:DUF2252 family protein [Candidatus Limnocylindria bacterium]
MRGIVNSTEDFEAWERKQTDLSDKLLAKKHGKMADGAFPFLRATFYRWVEQWPDVCPHLAKRVDDVLLAVGDLHVENFGTWLDSRERLVWGMNDFDEACELPFTSDLVRLATSAALAAEENHLVTDPTEIAALLLKGYRACLKAGGAPILLEGDTMGFPFALPPGLPENPEEFWTKKLDDKDSPVIKKDELDAEIVEMFRAAFPPGAKLEYRKQKKPGGLGSLGRRRFTAVLGDGKARTAREVKALVPSALYWIQDRPAMRSQIASLLQRAIRDPDPYFQIHDCWMLRQLAPDAVKIELGALPDENRDKLELALFHAMGWETANIHLGSRSPKGIATSLDALTAGEGADWLAKAATDMAEITKRDQGEWPKPSND